MPSHFPSDQFSLARFDGTALYEHADPVRGIHPDWGSLLFNYGRHEVRSFLASSADHWLRAYHADGLRVDAVASMLYLDYSRKPGEWMPNRQGGREDLDAVSFLRELNTGIYLDHPDVQTTAEESTAWPGVSSPVDAGGLGFGFKWDMGWMHDTLAYLAEDPIHRRFHHGELTFRSVYAFSENFVLPLSHDEVVHGKGPCWPRCRATTGRSSPTCGSSTATSSPSRARSCSSWAPSSAAWRSGTTTPDWTGPCSSDERHAGIARWIADLNRVYRADPALHELDTEAAGFDGCCATTPTPACSASCGGRPGTVAVVVCNFTPVPRHNVLVGVPERRLLAGAPQQRRQPLRRERGRQPGRSRGPTRAVARLAADPERHRPAAGLRRPGLGS